VKNKSYQYVTRRDLNAAINIRSETIRKLNRAGTAQIKVRQDAAHRIETRGSISDTSLNREKFLSTQSYEAKFSLIPW